MGIESEQPTVKVERDDSGSYFLLLQEGQRSIRVDVDFNVRNKIGVKSDLLARAIGYKSSQVKNNQRLQIVDATAGLCRDAFHLAALGCKVLALEENKILFSVLTEHISKLPEHYNLKIKNIKAELFFAKELTETIDVIYLDPMFPEKKKSAKSGKESILLKCLAAQTTEDEEGRLLDVALQVAKRVVVKRPRLAPTLKSSSKKFLRPTMQYEGKAVRYDVYVRL